jgi:O-antigen/teichoic acid export membrane protein
VAHGVTEPAQVVRTEARRVSINLLGLVAQVTGPAYHALVARAVGVGGYGLLGASTSLVDGGAFVVLFGMDLGVRRWVGRALAEGHGEDVHGVVATALRLVVLAGAALFAVAYVAAPWLADWLHKPGMVAPLRVLALGPLIGHVGSVLLCATQGAQEMKYAVFTRGLVQPLTLFAFVGLAAWLHPGVLATAAALVMVGVVTTAVAAWCYHLHFGLRDTLRAMMHGRNEPALTRYGAQLVAASVFWVVLARLDLLVYGRFAGAGAVGVMAACVVFSSAIPQVKAAFDTYLSTIIPRTLELGDLHGLRAGVARLARWSVLCVVPVYLVFGVFAGAMLSILGAEFAVGGEALAILLAGQLIAALCSSSLVIPMSGRTRIFGLTAIACGVLEATLLFLLIPRMGLRGAALASAVGIATPPLFLASLAYALTGATPVSRPVVRALVAGGLGGTAGRTLYALLPGSAIARAAAGIPAALLVYLVALLVLRLHAEDRALVVGVLRALRRAPPHQA